MDRLISEKEILKNAFYIKRKGCGLIDVVEVDAIKAIPSAEPCEDAISRQAVLDALEVSYLKSEIDDLTYQRVKDLPPIKPQEPTGHWIGIDEEPHEVWECDHCGFVIDGSGCIDPYDYRDTYKFCPNCGARMVEPQESEDKE